MSTKRQSKKQADAKDSVPAENGSAWSTSASSSISLDMYPASFYRKEKVPLTESSPKQATTVQAPTVVVEPTKSASSPSPTNTQNTKFNGDTTAATAGKTTLGTTTTASQNEVFKAMASGLYFRDGVRRIDFVLVYVVEKNAEEARKQAIKRETFEQNLVEAGLDLEHEKASDNFTLGNTFFVKLHAPWPFLCRQAELLKVKVPIKANDFRMTSKLKDVLDQCLLGRNPFKLGEKYESTEPVYYTAVFDRRYEASFIMKDRETFFTPSQRSRMVWDCLCRVQYDQANRERIGVMRLLRNGTYEAAYPLHEAGNKEADYKGPPTDRKLLDECWANPRMFYKYQPMELVRKYFGEKVAIYFAWLGFYTKTLLPAAIAGLLCIIYGAISLTTDEPSADVCDTSPGGAGSTVMCPLTCVSKNIEECKVWNLSDSCLFSKVTYVFDNTATVIFSVFMSVWATMFLEGWKRRQSELAWDWDLNEGEMEEETVRPEFMTRVKTRKMNPITQEFEPHLPYVQRLIRLLGSCATVVFFLCLVVALVFGIIVYRVIMINIFAVYENRVPGGATAIVLTSSTAAMINLAIILILDYLYQGLAWKLTDWECPRTEQQFEDSFTFKVFLFQFINYYSSLFYIAFFKGKFATVPFSEDNLIFGYRPEMCDPSGCMVELLIQLFIIMVGKQFLFNCWELCNPVIFNLWRRFRHKVKKGYYGAARWEKDFFLHELPPMTMFYEYLEMVLQYGFITLFVAAFPLAPFFALINNVLEIRLDAYKFLVAYRRPMPVRSCSLGIWYKILDGISHFSVLTNACVIAFTSDFIPRMIYKYSVSTDPELDRYIGNTLSYYDRGECHMNSTVTAPCSPQYCRYRDYRSPPCSMMSDKECKGEYQLTLQWWHVLAARLAFVLVFEHLVFFIKGIVASIVPDMPRYIFIQRQRENYLSRQALTSGALQVAGKSDQEFTHIATTRNSPKPQDEKNNPNDEAKTMAPIDSKLTKVAVDDETKLKKVSRQTRLKRV